MAVLAIDAGTTGVTAVVIDPDGTVVARGYQEFPQLFPRPGWVEHDPESIWDAVRAASASALATAPTTPTCVGITNQRETVVLWDRQTLAAPRPAIVWQDRRSAQLCERLRADGHESLITARTGLRLDPYFSATKLAWLAAEEPATWADVRAGRTAIGTVDSYLAARLTGGRVHVTDPSNASRTLLFDLAQGDWSDELCALFDVPRSALPEIVATNAVIGRTDPDAFLGLDLPVAALVGDQQSALFGQTCFTVGSSKCTYGTGSFVLVNTGTAIADPDFGLVATVGWQLDGQPTTYALEGSIFVTGAAVQWLRDGLGVIPSAAEIEPLAASVPDSGGLVFVPALTGLGAPDWDPYARGAMFGLTRGTTRAHVARATLDAIAFQVRDVTDAMARCTGHPLTGLTVDGGAAVNNLLCQLQADQLGLPVRRPTITETTALGAAYLAGLATGVWGSTDEITKRWHLDREFTAGAGADGRDEAHQRWRRAVAAVREWSA
ncbi:glycerol kinase GlpK [Micromonospora polyrhachis]|uniref:glycerol kinase n=1 Tax=Micromonospora polyrhachis TaxID=1282883 RepID=A0A7W7SRL9_9ACTN|nr:glycerol kinase GlpK [Micromonospora polyrhachis]MBB4959291.1 glycerol kinase [Micromonospora polyrhachis]